MKTHTLLAILFAFSICSVAAAQPPNQEQMEEQQKRQMEMMVKQQTLMRLMQFIHNPSSRDELGIVEDQVRDLTKVVNEYQREMSTFSQERAVQMRQLRELIEDGKHEEAMEIQHEFQEGMSKISDRYLEQVEEMLLPHQMKRLTQISRQEMLKHQSGYGDEFGLPLAIADELDLTAAEKKALREAIEKARDRYYEKVAKLKEQAHDEILGSIPADKRKRVKEILGDLFDERATHRKALDKMREKRREAEGLPD